MTDLLYALQSYSDLGLLVLRLTIGIIFLYHCRSKLSGSMGGFMQFIGYAELAGGTAMVLGFLTQLAALGLAIIMCGAIHKKITEWKIPFYAKNATGWEFDFMILGGCIAILLLGPGSMSLDRMLFML